jgi:hypothetical protein
VHPLKKCFPESVTFGMKRSLLKTNTDLSCEAFSEKLATNRGVSKKTHSSDKYHATARTSSSK